MDAYGVLWGFVTLFAGGLITFLVSRFYFRKAAEDLEAKVYRLERTVTLTALYLQHNEVISDVELDERGILKGYTQTIHVPPLSLQAEIYPPTVTQEDPDPENTDRPEDAP